MTHPFHGSVLAKQYPPHVGDLAAHVFLDDFDELSSNWTITTIEAGGGSASEAITGAANGVLLVTNDAADNDADAFQLANETFTFTAGKRTFFACRFQTNDATETDLLFGLQITDTTPFDASDGVWFLKADDADTLVLTSVKDSVATTSSVLGSVADDTWHTLAYEYNGYDSITPYFDAQRLPAIGVTSLPDDEALTPSFSIRNGAAAAKTLRMDYIYAAQER